MAFQRPGHAYRLDAPSSSIHRGPEGDAMSRRTALQEQLERSRRLLSTRTEDDAGADLEREPPAPTLGDFIRSRHRPPAEVEEGGMFDDLPSARGRGSIVAERIRRMREQASESRSVPVDAPLWSVVEDEVVAENRDPAMPVWRQVISHQDTLERPDDAARSAHARALGHSSSPPSPLQPTTHELTRSRASREWPPLLVFNEQYEWGNWQVGPENRMATTAAREVLLHTGTRMNPLLVIGPAGCGKSHLVWALGESLQTASPNLDVRLISSATMVSGELPEGWESTIQGCAALLVDDLDMICEDREAASRLGHMIDWALNLGVQVVLTAESESVAETAVPNLSLAMSGAVTISLSPPEASTLLLMLRRRTLRRGIALSDDQLSAVVVHSGLDWRRCAAGFETVALAIEAGSDPLDADDVRMLLEGGELPLRGEGNLLEWDTELTGQRIVSDALDHVLPQEAELEIDLESHFTSSSDDYQPPDLRPDSSESAVDSLLERHLGRERGALEEIRARRRLAEDPPAPEVPAGDTRTVEMISGGTLDQIESRLRRHQDDLESLQLEMEEISLDIDSATPAELAEMADRMLDIDRQLSRLSRLEPGEESSPRRRPERPYDFSEFDEYTPEGEWDIDEGGVSADDLLGERAILRPVRILVPDEEE